MGDICHDFLRSTFMYNYIVLLYSVEFFFNYTIGVVLLYNCFQSQNYI